MTRTSRVQGRPVCSPVGIMCPEEHATLEKWNQSQLTPFPHCWIPCDTGPTHLCPQLWLLAATVVRFMTCTFPRPSSGVPYLSKLQPVVGSRLWLWKPGAYETAQVCGPRPFPPPLWNPSPASALPTGALGCGPRAAFPLGTSQMLTNVKESSGCHCCRWVLGRLMRTAHITGLPLVTSHRLLSLFL